MMPARSRRWLVATVGVLLTVGASQPSASAGGSEEPVVLPASVESWYQVSPTGGPADPACGLPIGCLPPIPLPSLPLIYPENTLQVGISLGFDTAWTFLALDRGAIPDEIGGGSLRLPVLTDPASGTVSLEAAGVIACAATGPVTPSRGEPSTSAPAYDCAQSSPGRLDDTVDPPVYEFDVRGIADALRSDGVAIVPTTTARLDKESYRVVFPADGHESGLRVEATFLPGQAPPSTPSDDASVAPETLPDAAFGGAVPGPSFSAPTLPVLSLPPTPAPEDGPAQIALPIAAQPILPTPGYAYPLVWIAPFLIAGVALMTSRSLTKPLTLPLSELGAPG